MSQRLDMISSRLIEATRLAHAAFVEYLPLMGMYANASTYRVVAELDKALQQNMTMEGNVVVVARAVKIATDAVFTGPGGPSSCSSLMFHYLEKDGDMQNPDKIAQASICAHRACLWADMYLMNR